jgi:hypothetical protein
MRIIQDNNGDSWELHLGLDEYRRLRSELKIDLAMHNASGAFGGTLSTELMMSAAMFLDVLFVLCSARAANKRTRKEDFDAAFFGKATAPAREAFFGEWSDFFLNLDQTLDSKIVSNVPVGWQMVLQRGLMLQEQELGRPSTTSSSGAPESAVSNTSGT